MSVIQTSQYVPLWCKSNYSFLEGASHPDELVETAHYLGLPGIALTDRNGIYGIVQAHQKAKELGVHLLVGAQLSVDDGSSIVLLATDQAAYSRLCGLITVGCRRSAKGQCQVTWEEVCESSLGLIALWGGQHSLLVNSETTAFDSIADRLCQAFGDRLYAMVARHQRAEEQSQEALLRERAARYGLSLVGSTEVLYHAVSRRPLQDVLTCIRHKTSLREAGKKLNPNDHHDLKTIRAIQTLFQDEPALISRTVEVAARCTFSLDAIRYRYPSEALPDGTTTAQWLRQLTYVGAGHRYNNRVPKAVSDQLEKELHLITALDYCGYFLTMAEIVRFCRENEILCQGRGSAANSAVCYCLGITAVDPVRMGLLFERFISAERAEPPDIDLDIAHERREEVIQHVYQKYGRDRAAMVANVIRYRTRSAVRDVGKALGLPETGLDRVAKSLGSSAYVHTDPSGDKGRVETALERAGVDADVQTYHHLVQRVDELRDFPRHLSIHPGGFLLGHQPVHHIVPIENATMPGRTVIQWDKYDVEALGLFKVDLLGLGALSHLDRCFRLIQAHHHHPLCMATIPAQDPATYQMIQKGDTVGVFQIESRAQMSMLPRLRPETFYDLVIEISIIRPGPITGGMVHPYLRRRHGQEPVLYPHPSLEPVLKKTLGVPLFQEQVMRLAVVAADYTPGEADQLRRDMAAWRRTGRIEHHRERLVSRMVQKGIEAQFAQQVFEQIRGFGEYGFPESHAASFALIAYATAWLRCHYPEAFTCALLNAQPMGFYSPATVIDDAKRHGVRFLPIDVNQSHWECSLYVHQQDIAIRMGARYVKGIQKSDWMHLLQCRSSGAFTSLLDLTHRTGLGKGVLGRLAEAGALHSIQKGRRGALWDVLGHTSESAPAPDEKRLLEPQEVPPGFEPLSLQDAVHWDYARTGHSVTAHPLAPMREALSTLGLPSAYQLNHLSHGQRVRYAGIVICRQRPGTAAGITFMTLEDETGFVNVVIWKQTFERYSSIGQSAPFLGITGKIQSDQGVVHLVAEKLWVPDVPDTLMTPKSRDFR